MNDIAIIANNTCIERWTKYEGNRRINSPADFCCHLKIRKFKFRGVRAKGAVAPTFLSKLVLGQ